MHRTALALLAVMAAAPATAGTGTLAVMANGEALAVEGFVAPTLTRDGWTLRFDRVLATVTDITAWRTDPPFEADGPTIEGDAVAVPGIHTLDLAATTDDGRVPVAAAEAAAGHYNALSWSLVPASEGPFAGYSLVLVGTATRGGESVAFTLATRDSHAYACGEYVGEVRLGFLEAGGTAEVEMTFHLDHLFGRADLPQDDAMNVKALGFDRFAAGGMQSFALGDLHLAHVGEGHCHVAPR